jgi:hypothetical protein
MFGQEDEDPNDDTQKSRLINDSVMRELKKEKLIEASSHIGRFNKASRIQNKP